MSTIHQIYCTHCTHGTSALERREGELAHRMLGYSARAGSLEARDLRRFYRQIERYVYYYLPKDTPGEEKLRLTASSAPRRLIYHPSTGGLQLVGQICYRQTDTEGRPGSYFAHVLFREEADGQPPWSQLDCLKLWGAPGWVEEDSPDVTFLLQPLAALDQMLGGRRPAIDDQVLLSFLSAPPGGSFDDPAGAIPQRWRRMDAGGRRRLFTDAFRGFLELSGARRQSLLLVVEPSVAALVFYGILRLLPPGKIRQQLSFSTFEPNTDRVGASLAATWFHNAEKAELRPDAYRSRGFAINTVSGRRSEIRRPQAEYAQAMVRRLVEQGWDAVDGTLADLAAAGAQRPEDLETLAAVDRIVPALFDPQQTSPGQSWRKSAMATSYLRQAVGRRLAGSSDPGALLEPILGGPAHLLLLEMIAVEPQRPGTQETIEVLLGRLPAEKIGELLKLDRVSTDAKVDVLVRHVTSQGELPPGCDHLWSEAGRSAGSRAGAPLLVLLLSRLDPETLRQFYRRTAERHADAFLTALLEGYKQGQSDRSALTRVVKLLDDRALLSLFRSRGTAFFKEYPQDEPTLGGKLHQVVTSLPDHPRQFPTRLDLVLAGRHLLLDDDLEMAAAWASCRRVILKIGQLQAHKPGILRSRPLDALEDACRQMAETVGNAMPSKWFDDDRQGSRKQDCLRQIGQGLLSKPLLPPNAWQHKALWQKITWYFERGRWSSTPLRKMAPKSWPLKSSWMTAVGVAAGLLVGVSAAVWLIAVATRGRGDNGRATPATRPPAQARTDQRPTGRIARESARSPQAARKPPSAEKAPTRREADGTRSRPSGSRQTPGSPVAVGHPSVDGPQGRTGERPEAAQGRERDSGEPGARRKAEAAMMDSPLADAGPRPAEDLLPKIAGLPVGVAKTPRGPRAEDIQGELDAWKADAEQFARRYGGLFLDQEPLTDGKLLIPSDALPSAMEGSRLFLSEGLLHFEHAVSRFGVGFEKRSPVTRHELPELARLLGFDSVYVELRRTADGTTIVLDRVPLPMPPDAESRKRARLEQVERGARLIRVQLRQYNAQGASKEVKDAAFENLVKLTGIPIPRLPQKPSRRSPEHSDKPGAYEAALREYNEAVAAHNRATAKVVPTAMEMVASVEKRQEEIEAEFKRFEEQLREYNQLGSARLREQCRGISVVVYPAESADHAAAPAEPEIADGRPPGGAALPAERPTRRGSEVVVREGAARGLKPPAIARLRPMVTGSEGAPLPSWYREKLVTGCSIVGENEQGLISQTIDLEDLEAEKTTDVFQDTVALRIRFGFYRRSGIQSGGNSGPLAATEWHRIERIGEGKQYTVTLMLGKDELDMLRLMARGSGGA